ncbi:MAG: sulfatase-like hydrolase/transferase [Nannocystaceae bacterium]
MRIHARHLAPARATAALICALIVTTAALAPSLASARGRPWQLRDHATPQTLRAGTSTSVEITLRNLGDEPISEALGDRLAYHWLDADGEVVHYDGQRTRFADAVAPGAIVVVDATLEAPREPGSYLLQWEPVREQVGWYGPPRRSKDVLIPVEVVAGAPQWRLLGAALPSSLRAGEEVEVTVRLRNDGDEAWDPAAGDRLSYHWRDAAGVEVLRDGLRTALPRVVGVGEEVELRARVRAPTDLGRHALVWEPLREGVRWRGDPAPAIAVEIVAGAVAWAPLAEAPAELHAGERVVVDVVVDNRGEAAIDPAAGDRLSYHWLTADDEGRAVVWDGLRSDLPRAAAAGERVAVAADLQAPVLPGRYRLVWSLVREGAGWFPAAAATGEVEVEVLPPWLAFEVEAVDWPRWLPAVGEVEVEVTVRNTGAATWAADGADRLSYHWLAADGATLVEREGLRTPLPRAVAPGEAVTVPIVVRGPGEGGDFVLAIDMVREHVAWFGEPEGGPPPRASIHVVWRSGIWQLVLLAITGLALFAARRWRPRPGSARWSWFGLVPALWAFAATWLVVLTFADLCGIALWRAAEPLAPATAALPALAIVLAPSRWRAWLTALWIALLCLLGLADLVYLHFLGSIVPVQALTAAHQVGDIAASVRAVLEPAYAWLAPLPIAALLFALLWPRRPRSVAAPPRWRWGVRAAATLVAAAAAWPFVAELREIMASDLGKRVFSEQRNVGRLGLVGAHVFDATRALRERLVRSEASPAEVAALEAFFGERDAERRAAAVAGGASTFAAAAGANVLVVQIESLQGWVIGATVDGQEVTPFLNGLRARGLYFPRIADVAAQGMTSDAEYATLNSAYPLAQGAIAFLRAGNHFYTLAHVLAERGYATLSSHPYKRGFWNRAALHPRYGFARSLFARELGPGRRISWGLADEPFFARVLPEIEALPRPFFAFLVTISVHHPYSHFPAERRRMELGALEGTALGNYLHGMREMDEAVAGLFAELEAAGLAAQTVVALYGDHDARLGTPPEVLALAGVERWTPAVPTLLERVPLFIVAPPAAIERAGAEALTGASPRVGSLVDFAPTLLHLLGAPSPAAFVGAPLLPAADRPGGEDGRVAAYADGSALSADRLYVAGGRDIGGDGACFSADGEPLRRGDCDALAAAAQAHLEASRAVVDFDLARALGGADGGAETR